MCKKIHLKRFVLFSHVWNDDYLLSRFTKKLLVKVDVDVLFLDNISVWIQRDEHV